MADVPANGVVPHLPWMGLWRDFDRRARAARNTRRRAERVRADVQQRLDPAYTADTREFRPVVDSPHVTRALMKDTLAHEETGRARRDWSVLRANIDVAVADVESLQELVLAEFVHEVARNADVLNAGGAAVDGCHAAVVLARLKARAARTALVAHRNCVAPRTHIARNQRALSNAASVHALLVDARVACELAEESDAVGDGRRAVEIADALDATIQRTPALTSVRSIQKRVQRARARRRRYVEGLRRGLAVDMARHVVSGLHGGCGGVVRAYVWWRARATEATVSFAEDVAARIQDDGGIAEHNAGACADRAHALWAALADDTDVAVEHMRLWVAAVDASAANRINPRARVRGRADVRRLVAWARVGRLCHERVDTVLMRYVDAAGDRFARDVLDRTGHADAWAQVTDADIRDACARLRLAASDCDHTAACGRGHANWEGLLGVRGCAAVLLDVLGAAEVAVALYDHAFAGAASPVGAYMHRVVAAWAAGVAHVALGRSAARVVVGVAGAARAVASVHAAVALVRIIARDTDTNAHETLLACDRARARLCDGLARSVAAIARGKDADPRQILAQITPPLCDDDVRDVLTAPGLSDPADRRKRRNSGFV